MSRRLRNRLREIVSKHTVWHDVDHWSQDVAAIREEAHRAGLLDGQRGAVIPAEVTIRCGSCGAVIEQLAEAGPDHAISIRKDPRPLDPEFIDLDQLDALELDCPACARSSVKVSARKLRELLAAPSGSNATLHV